MLNWLIAAAAALALVWFQYHAERRTRIAVVSMVLRGLAVFIAVALALDAARGTAATRTPVVALDASASWRRGRADSAWMNAVARARAAARGDTVWLVGDSIRPLRDEKVPADVASRVEAAVDRALGAGRPLVLISDGEIDDPASLDRLLAGSRLDIAPPGSGQDAAVLALELPRSVVGGDTAEVLLRIAAGPNGVLAGNAMLTIDRVPLVRMPVDALAPNTERDVRARVRIPVEGAEHRVVRAVLAAQGDVVAGNDTLSVALDVASTPKAVFVSTAPDQDSRFALEVLRGTLAIAVRAYYRVAPGVWRQEPGFTPATQADVKKALGEAPIAILHGDTTLFGDPRTATGGALALIVPTAGDGDDWYAVGAPVSPLSSAISGLPFDSLAPIALGISPKGDWTALTARRPRTMRDERALIAGTERPRHIVVVAGSGMWRWRFRGGASADAYAALWGGLFDWMTSGGDDRRGAVPASAWTRAGEAVEWRRGARRDTAVAVVLRQVGGTRVDSVTLHFPGDAILAESPSLPMGEYNVTVSGGTARLVVAQSREWLPRRATVKSGSVGSSRAGGLAPRLRDAWWAYVLVVLALSAEWLLRRRVGLR